MECSTAVAGEGGPRAPGGLQAGHGPTHRPTEPTTGLDPPGRTGTGGGEWTSMPVCERGFFCLFFFFSVFGASSTPVQ